MKSMLHEGSTVVKAVQKAWEASGMPVEFTINVHEAGERNFFGFCKRPAIVSITYDPRKAFQSLTQNSKKKDFRDSAQSGNRFDARSGQAARGRNDAGQRPKGEVKPKVQPDRDRNLQPYQGPVRVQSNQPVQQNKDFVRPEGAVVSEPEQWTQEMANDIRDWLSETVVLMEIKTPFTLQFDRRMLTVSFEEALLQSPDDERQLFMGLSYLLMQFLKKKCKKKLRGHHLVFNSKRSSQSNEAA